MRITIQTKSSIPTGGLIRPNEASSLGAAPTLEQRALAFAQRGILFEIDVKGQA